MKKLKLSVAVLLTFAVLAAVIVCVIAVIFRDRIVFSEEQEVDAAATMVLLHETESGSEICIPVTAEYIDAGDDTYRINVFVSQSDDRRYYEAKNLKLELDLSEKLEVVSVSRFWGEGENKGSEVQGAESPDVAPENGVKALKYETESCYMILDVYVKGDKPEPAVLKLQYDIDGKGRYAFNHFSDIESAVEVKVQDN